MRHQHILSACLVSTLLGLGACGLPTPADSELSPAMRALGAEIITIDETAVGVSIDGSDANGNAVVHIDLRVGRFTPQLDDRGEVYGRTMSVTILGKETRHESEG